MTRKYFRINNERVNKTLEEGMAKEKEFLNGTDVKRE